MKSFSKIQTLEELNAVNDAQKEKFRTILEATGDPIAASNQRQEAYLHRWKEALAYIEPGATTLDIGGGWPIERVWNAIIKDHKVNYHLADIAQDIVQQAQEWLPRFGLPSENAIVTTNTSLPYGDDTFDFVFTSHCIEHSTDLSKTFEEISRVLKPSGQLFFAVPFGFDDSDEHLLFLGIEDWMSAAELAGFDVINTHIGKTYPQGGWDFCVIGRHGSNRRDLAALKNLATRLNKTEKAFASGLDPVFKYFGPVVDTDRHKILTKGCHAIIASENVESLLFLQDEWCGIAEISSKNESKIVDLYSRFPVVGAIDVTNLSAPITVRSIGRNRGLADNIIVHGAILSDWEDDNESSSGA